NPKLLPLTRLLKVYNKSPTLLPPPLMAPIRKQQIRIKDKAIIKARDKTRVKGKIRVRGKARDKGKAKVRGREVVVVMELVAEKVVILAVSQDKTSKSMCLDRSVLAPVPQTMVATIALCKMAVPCHIPRSLNSITRWLMTPL